MSTEIKRLALLATLLMACVGDPTCPYDDRCTLRLVSGSDCTDAFDLMCWDSPAGRSAMGPAPDDAEGTFPVGEVDPESTTGPWLFEGEISGCRYELTCDPAE